jgi:uncharacterized protein with NRDE domain
VIKWRGLDFIGKVLDLKNSLFPQSDNVLNEQSRDVLMRGYNKSQKVRGYYGGRGHYQDEFEGFEKVEGFASGIRQAYNSEDGGVNVGS